MVGLFRLIHLVAQSAGDSGGSPLPAWLGAGVSSAFLSGLWWMERADRKSAEERTRQAEKRTQEVLEADIARALESQRLLDRQADLLRTLGGR